MNSMLNIGATKESVTAARNAIMDILKVQHVDGEVKMKALDVLSDLCEINNVTIQNCNFDNKSK